MANARRNRVIVLGAGLAGLSCAFKLRQMDFDVVVLEARDRVGGRVETLREPFSNGLSAEAGAFWISDNHRLALQYLQDFNLAADQFELLPKGRNLPYYFHASRHFLALDEETGLALDHLDRENPQLIDWPLPLGAMEKGVGLWALFGRYLCARTEIVDATSHKWPLAQMSADLQKYDDMSFVEFLRRQGASDAAIALIRPWFGWWDDLDKVSALALLRDGAVTRQICADPPPKWYSVRSGMDSLPRAFEERLIGSGVHLRKNCPATGIEQSNTEVSVIYDKDRRERGDYLVCAIPFSCLRRIANLPFGHEKLKAIKELQYASVARVYVQCRDRKWDPRRRFNGVAFVDLPDDAGAEPATCRMNLLDMTFGSEGQMDQGIWQGYMVGSLARRVTNEMDKPERVKFFLQQMEFVYRGITKSYEDAGSHGTSKCWDEDDWARGAYPLFRPGQMMELMPHIALPEGRVFFAGDHTSGNPGWMEGALQSGHRAAKEVLRRSLAAS